MTSTKQKSTKQKLASIGALAKRLQARATRKSWASCSRRIKSMLITARSP